ncbi:hypothetical protein LZL87_009547 [Fusarium oxysporum]|nr:hypothetical protein LZL87_009547 [Fusarium oxysporum]
MLAQPSSLARRPNANFLGLPLELRQQIYHDYFKVHGGYVYDGDSDKLFQVAAETKSSPFKLNSMTFSTLYRKDLQHQAAIHSNLIRYHTLLLSELLLQMRYFVTPEMFDQVDEVAPQYLQTIKRRVNGCIRDDEYEVSEDDDDSMKFAP